MIDCKRAALFIAASLAMAPIAICAQDTNKETLKQNLKDAKKSSPDATFIFDAAQGNLAEIQAGKLAEEKSQNPAAQQLAKHMVQDHQKAYNQLKQIAQQEGITIPSQPSDKQIEEYNKLREKSGADFDQAFAKLEVKAHQETIRKFEEEVKRGADPQAKAYAAETLPTLRQHLQMARVAEHETVTEAAGAQQNK